MPATTPYSLGIDIGSASLGWAAIELDSNHKPASILRTGVRIFDPGVEGTMYDILRGKEQSKAAERRQARLHRRQLRRKTGRQRDLCVLLQSKGFLPAYPPGNNSPGRHELLTNVDAELRTRWLEVARKAGLAAPDQVLPYFLRARGLDEKLDAVEVGRVLYHLAQRRGFKSNRREAKKDKEKEAGEVKKGISTLHAEIKAAGARTLGEYLMRLDPHAARIRHRWTSRSMYETEFDEIWKKQAGYYPDLLTLELKKKIQKLLFFQRPIASNAHLIGDCELEKGKKRAAWASLPAQSFRILQQVNDLRVVAQDGSERGLSGKERKTLVDALEGSESLTFAKIKQLLRLPADLSFSLERGGEKKLKGNRTTSAMTKAFGSRWAQLTSSEQDAIVEQWRTIENRESVIKRAIQHWGLSEKAAAELADKNPEDGYCRLSRKATFRLLPLMREGVSFKEAESRLYPNRFSGGKEYEKLPRVREALPDLRNPAIERSLTELRKLVNALVRRYGKPYEIQIELARDLKKPRWAREKEWSTNRERQKQREQAAERVIKQKLLPKPSRDDIEKVLLWQECKGTCPYTGRSIPFHALFSGEIDVEHILPISRFPDDSFANKTLCYHSENANKHNSTPYEVYGPDEERWASILERVRKFGNPGKFARFQITSDEGLEDFTHRQLNDTRYASKLAARYLGLLYGGRDVSGSEVYADGGNGKKRRVIFASSGTVTATVRKNWGLEAILREAPGSSNGHTKGKPRTDHRHHAVDAIAIALTSQATIQKLSAAAAAGVPGFAPARNFRFAPPPWADFVPSVRPHIEKIVVSHRPKHKLSGGLHDENSYSEPYTEGARKVAHIRKSLRSITVDEIEDIADEAVKRAVRERLGQLGADITKLRASVEPGSSFEPPKLTGRNGQPFPIYRVRIRKSCVPRKVGSGTTEKYVLLENNHHIEIFAEVDHRGREKSWCGKVVPLLDAMERSREGKPVVQRHLAGEENAVFKFSLMKGDTVEADVDGARQLFVVRSFSQFGAGPVELVFSKHTDAQKKKDQKLLRKKVDPLRKADCRKIAVDILGNIHPAND